MINSGAGLVLPRGKHKNKWKEYATREGCEFESSVQSWLELLLCGCRVGVNAPGNGVNGTLYIHIYTQVCPVSFYHSKSAVLLLSISRSQ